MSHSESLYLKIWLVLIGLLLFSLLLGFLDHVLLATTLIFTIATVKAFLVIVYYMGLRQEARYIRYILFGGLLLLAILFFTLFPDSVQNYGS